MGLSAADVLKASGSSFEPVPGVTVNVGPASAASVPTVATVTVLPSSPSDGKQVIFVDSTSTPTYAWLMQWSASASEWLFIGGSYLFVEVTTSETTTSTSYAALTTAGPAATLPFAADYEVEIGYEGVKSDGTNAVTGMMSYDIGVTGAVDADAATSKQGIAATGINTNPQSVSRVRRKTGLTAVTLTAKYRVDIGTGGFKNRWMRVRPIST